jgi:serine/threonine protein kinase
MECPYCKAENRDGVRYCANCGKPLSPTIGGSSSRSLAPGARLQGGRYVIKKVLGQGGMGTALLAIDNRLDGKPVIIKELISDSADPSRFQEDVRNFKREMITLAHLDHPLIPNVTDHFQEGTRYFMVQEYVDGENLEERISRLNAPMREQDVLVYASEVLDILDYLSLQTPPIVHRDIKPANIIIGAKDKKAHLVDFGIARADEARNAQRKQTAALGTPGYAPPEQYQGNADPRSDLYALGATLHHLLTNRDPRLHPPFNYPPVRTLNPQLSLEIERVLTRALHNDVNQRYQSAAQMKRDLDDILYKRFGISGNIDSYTVGTLATLGAGTSGQPASGSPLLSAQPGTANSLSQPVLPPQQPYPAPSAYPSTPPSIGLVPTPTHLQQPQSRRRVGLPVVLLLVIVALLSGGTFAAFTYFRTRSTNTDVYVTKVGNEYIGISDGSFAFDTSNRIDGQLKTQASQSFQKGDIASAVSEWNAAIAQDTNDAEALIYLENQRVISSNSPYITLVVATLLSGSNSSVGRDDLQGAYVAQKEFNDGSLLPGGVKVRLLIANAGSQQDNTTWVAQQIVQLAKSDKTFVGVMGWPFSGYAFDAVQILGRAHIPMVSQTASSDALTGISPYFFRVAPSNKTQGIAGAKYAEQTLHAHKIALFVDNANLYSQSLAKDFSDQFTADGNTIAVTEKYTVGNPATLPGALQDALKHNPDLIYFSGYASDLGTLLTDLVSMSAPSSLLILGGDALYELNYPSSARAGFSRLRFTAFAYPDEWGVLGMAAREPAFFSEYPAAFDPNQQHAGSPYGYTRPDSDVMLSYDAMIALLKGCSGALSGGKQTITPEDLRQALTQIQGSNAFQGVSGLIVFGPQGDPVDKSIVILYVDPDGHIKMEPARLGRFS